MDIHLGYVCVDSACSLIMVNSPLSTYFLLSFCQRSGLLSFTLFEAGTKYLS